MAEKISRSVYHTTLNLFRLLAERGDPDAVISLKEMEETDFDVIDDDDSGVQIVVQSSKAEYLVTELGTIKVPFMTEFPSLELLDEDENDPKDDTDK